MDFWTVLSWALFSILLAGLGFLGGTWLVSRRGSSHLGTSIKYILDRLKVAEIDLSRLVEEIYVLKEHFRRRGMVDDEDLELLRRELIEIRGQLEAEKNELLRGGLPEERKDRLVKNTPETLN